MILLAVALAVLVGVAAVQLLWRPPLGPSLESLAVVSFGIGAGFGICSSLYFLWLVMLGPKTLALAVFELAILAVLTAAVVWKYRGRPAVEPKPPSSAIPLWLSGALVGAAVIATLVFVISSLRNPDGGYDAFAIWNLRARFLVRGGDFWRDAFSVKIPWTHPDYPLLLPGIVAMTSAISGSESTLGPISIAFLFLGATAGTLVATLSLLRGRAQAFLAGILVLSTSAFVLLSGYQYADIPLSFYILATLSALCLRDLYRGTTAFSVLAGGMAGFAAWTKNEGLLFVVAVVLARSFSLIRFEGWKPMARQMTTFAAGVTPILAVLAVFKIGFAPPNDLLAPHAQTSFAGNLIDVGRYITVLTAFVQQCIAMGGFLVPIILVLAIYLYLVKPGVEQKDKATAWTLLLTIGLMLAGDFGVYQMLSYALEFQLRTSLDRILLQVWPAAILAFFFVAKTPQLQAQVVEKRATAKQASKNSRKTAETR